MRFGMGWVPDDLTTYGELVRQTEAIGVDRIGVPDTEASVYRECYVTLDTSSRAPSVSSPARSSPTR